MATVPAPERMRSRKEGEPDDLVGVTPAVALGIIAMIGLVATTPEAYAERTPNAPIHGPHLRAAPHHR